ncbi:MAG: hypothetical protein WC861_07170 [Candidatus Micrarchaeia archaeon]|jgi:hypothetical protein
MNILAHHAIARINLARENYCKTGYEPARLVLEYRIRRKCNLLLNLDMPKGARSVLEKGTSLNGIPEKNQEAVAKLKRELFTEFSPLIESCEKDLTMRGLFVTMLLMVGYVATKAYASKGSIWHNNVDNLLEAAWWSQIASHASYALKRAIGKTSAVKDYFSEKFPLIGPTVIFGIGSFLEVLQKHHLYFGTYKYDEKDFIYMAVGALVGYLTGKIAVHDVWIYKGRFKS